MGDTSRYPLRWFLKQGPGENDGGVGLIILNYKLHGLEHIIRKYWDYFSVKACADGGSNVLFDTVDGGNGRYVPDFICGDMDSARKEVLEFYESKGCTIQRLPDQNKTDFAKTLDYLTDLKNKRQLHFSAIYVINGIGGRFDQTLAHINTLYSGSDEYVYLLSEDSLSFVLEPGRHSIFVDSQLEEGHCGLIPLGEPCSSCTTTGLTWNLCNDAMELGGLVSTNNLIAHKEVTVKNSSKLLWTMSHTLLNHQLYEV